MSKDHFLARLTLWNKLYYTLKTQKCCFWFKKTGKNFFLSSQIQMRIAIPWNLISGVLTKHFCGFFLLCLGNSFQFLRNLLLCCHSYKAVH